MTSATATNRRRPAIVGAVAVAAAFGVAELLAGLLSAGVSVVVAVGNLIIDISPESVVRFGIRVFGFYDKPVLVAGIVVVASVISNLARAPQPCPVARRSALSWPRNSANVQPEEPSTSSMNRPPVCILTISADCLVSCNGWLNRETAW